MTRMNFKESSIERWVCRKARLQFGVPNLKITQPGSTGWPDRLFLIPGGRPLFIEFKKPGEEPEKIQLHRHEELRALGYDIEVHDTREGAINAIEDAVLRSEKCQKNQ